MLCKIGEVEVWRILEINAPFMPVEDLFPTAQDLAASFDRHGPGQVDIATGRLILPVQGFLLRTPSHLILVDACVGNDKTARFAPWAGRQSGRFLAALTAAGAAPEDVDYVLCTHLHLDHVGWNTRRIDGRWVPTFANARYLMPQADHAPCRSASPDMYRESISPVIEAGQAEFVTADHQLGDHVRLIATHGHTPGHVSVLIQSQGQEAVITGDAIHTTVQCWHPEWHFVYDDDPVQAATSRVALLASSAEANRRVLGTHFTLPSLGRVRAKGDAFEWVPD